MCGQQQSIYKHIQLYGSKEEPEKTATFILQTGLSEQQQPTRKRKRRQTDFLAAGGACRGCILTYIKHSMRGILTHYRNADSSESLTGLQFLRPRCPVAKAEECTQWVKAIMFENYIKNKIIKMRNKEIRCQRLSFDRPTRTVRYTPPHPRPPNWQIKLWQSTIRKADKIEFIFTSNT